MRSKVVKNVCIFAVMLAVLVSTVAFSASAFSFDADSGYTSSFLMINNVSSVGLPSSGNIVLAILGNVKITPANGQYASRTVSSARLVWYASSGNLVLDINDSSFAYLASAASNSSLVSYYPTNNNPVSVSYVKVSYDTISNVNANFQNVVVASSDQYYNEGYDNGYDTGYGVGEDVGYQDGYTDGFGEGANADYQQGFQDGVNSIGNVGNSYIWASVSCKVEWYDGGSVRSVPLNMDIINDTVSFPNATTTISQYCADQGISYPTWCYLVFTLVEDGSFIFNSASRIYVNGYPSPGTLDISITEDASLGQESWTYLDFNTEDGYFYKMASANITVDEIRLDVQSISALNQLRLTTNLKYDNLSFKAGYAEGYEDAMRGDAQTFDEIYQNGYDAGADVGYREGYQDGLMLGSDGNFRSLITSVIDVPLNAFKSLLNFEILGVNMFGFVTSLFTLAIAMIVIKRLI